MKIAFTSCMNHEQYPSQPVWDQIAAEQPDYLFLLGDQIYMDFFPHLGAPAKLSDAAFGAAMAGHYQAQWAVPQFNALVTRLRARQDQGGGVYGTWDDHDFAWDNAVGSEVPTAKRVAARDLFRQYVHQNVVPNDGVYYAITLQHGGQDAARAIFLDTRSYREPPGDDSALLGQAQLDFLEAQLNHGLPLTILCAGTPMRATGKGWLRHKREYERFLGLIGQRKVLFLSGDIHENAFLPPSTGTNLYEVIASGAAIDKFACFGKRRNYGLLECLDDRIEVKLVDKRGAVSYTIDTATFGFIEREGP